MAKRETSKDKAAKAKIANLLKDTNILGKEEEVDVLEKKTEEEGTDWLQDSMDELTKENEDLKGQLEKAIGTIHDGKAPISAAGAGELADIKRGARALFKDLDDNYQGRNKERRRYPDASLKILLEKFLREFPFLMKK